MPGLPTVQAPWRTAAGHPLSCFSQGVHGHITLVTLTTTLNKKGGREGNRGSHGGQENHRGKGKKEIPAESPPQEECKRAV